MAQQEKRKLTKEAGCYYLLKLFAYFLYIIS